MPAPSSTIQTPGRRESNTGWRTSRDIVVPGRHEEVAMDWRLDLLAKCGYQIVSISGIYCRACRDDRDVVLRWDGERWLVL
jgi:hypothetical protein